MNDSAKPSPKKTTPGGESHSASSPPPSPPIAMPRGRGRPQFGMRGMMAVVMLLCVPFALLGGLWREGEHMVESPRVLVYIVAAVAAPMLVMVLVSLVKPAVALWRR